MTEYLLKTAVAIVIAELSAWVIIWINTNLLSWPSVDRWEPFILFLIFYVLLSHEALRHEDDSSN